GNPAHRSCEADLHPSQRPFPESYVSGNGPRRGSILMRLPLSSAGCEFLLTTILLFSVVTAVRWLRDPSSGAYIASLRPALAVLAGITAVLLVALILSPLGRHSGGHM